jgi:hypothetical protein
LQATPKARRGSERKLCGKCAGRHRHRQSPFAALSNYPISIRFWGIAAWWGLLLASPVEDDSKQTWTGLSRAVAK